MISKERWYSAEPALNVFRVRKRRVFNKSNQVKIRKGCTFGLL